jgi:hypothetical protein
LLKFSERGHELAPGVSDGDFQFLDIESERCESLEILFGVADDHFEWLYLVRAVVLVIADAANNCFLDAFWLEAYQVQHLTHVAVAFSALRVVELL